MTGSSRPRRLDQLMSQCGYCSRGEAKGWIKRDRITVDGVPAESLEVRVDPSRVRVDGEPVDHPDGILVLFHKPVGTICTHEEEEGEIIYELLPERWKRRNPPVSSVGRLDKDASGLLVLTDQGHLVQRWTSPRHHVAKLYEVTLDREPSPEWVEVFASGTLKMLGDAKPCAPARLELGTGCQVRLELTEGRYHQVKRMFGALDAVVITLHRTRFGPFELGDLAPGTWVDIPMPDV